MCPRIQLCGHAWPALFARNEQTLPHPTKAVVRHSKLSQLCFGSQADEWPRPISCPLRVESRPQQRAEPRSALPSIADIMGICGEVSFGPLSDSCIAAEPAHSITSLARPNRAIGKATPSALAVLRLMTNSVFVDCWTGRSAGFAPLRIRPT
jgi:hypothetical protein